MLQHQINVSIDEAIFIYRLSRSTCIGAKIKNVFVVLSSRWSVCTCVQKSLAFHAEDLNTFTMQEKRQLTLQFGRGALILLY